MTKTYTNGSTSFEYTAKLWEKNGMRRLYINEGRETLGYFDLVNQRAVIPGRSVNPILTSIITEIAAEWEPTSTIPGQLPRYAGESDAAYARRQTEDVLYHNFD